MITQNPVQFMNFSFVKLNRTFPMWGFVCSVFFHIILSQTFVFTFASKPLSKNPEFIFLGSILQAQDLSISEISKNTPQTSFTQTHLTDANIIQESHDIYNFSSNKPYKFNPPSAKKFSKTVFPIDTSILNRDSKQQKDSFNNPYEELYQHLRLP